MSTGSPSYDPVATLRADGSGLVACLVAGPPDLPVPTLGAWALADLDDHVSHVWRVWAAIVRGGITEEAEVEKLRSPQPVVAADALDDLVSALAGADPTTMVWTWTGGDRPVTWVSRRMAQEAAVHRWDAEAALGRSFSIDPTVAADGVDEFLTWFARDRSEGAEAPGGTILLACTDVDAGWLVTRVAQDDLAYAPVAGSAGAAADVAVRASASDLLLWLWRRAGGPVTIEGDVAVANRFQAGTDLE